MKILHYFLGFPPYRTGGLTTYCFDLMCTQHKRGDIVCALWPGRYSCVSKKVRIKKNKDIKGIENFEIKNPLPVPLDEGIKDVKAFTKKCNELVYDIFLSKLKPDIIHVHTLMGLHYEFFSAAKKLNIRIIFTTHDYFGLCPKVTLFRNGCVCENNHGYQDCIQCNSKALSLIKIVIMQSKLYRILKNTKVVSELRKNHRKNFFSNDEMPKIEMEKEKTEENVHKYKELSEYYIKMFCMIDFFHFNSTISKKVYENYFVPKSSQVISISHKAINNNKYKNNWNYTGKLKITYLAPPKPFKGFMILERALDELWEEKNINFELKIFSPVQKIKPYMIVKEEGYNYEDIGNIFANTDVLVAPSVWYETFGFTVLEALSYGVPVIVSDHVGAKDIIGEGGIIVKAGDVGELKQALCSLTEEKQAFLRKKIRETVNIKSWNQLIDENYKIYKRI